MMRGGGTSEEEGGGRDTQTRSYFSIMRAFFVSQEGYVRNSTRKMAK